MQGHADLKVGNQLTLGLTRAGGGLEGVEPDLIAKVLGSHSPSSGGCLELVVLNGCESEALGRAIFAAGIPTVVCWKTKVHDHAARIFSRCFFQQIATFSQEAPHLRTQRYVDACTQAKLAVLSYPKPTPKWEMTSGPMFELVDPAQHENGKLPNGKMAAGIPLLLLEPASSSSRVANGMGGSAAGGGTALAWVDDSDDDLYN